MRVAGEVDQLPDLIPVKYREECRGVLEMGGGAVPGSELVSDAHDHIGGRVVVRVTVAYDGVARQSGGSWRLPPP